MRIRGSWRMETRIWIDWIGKGSSRVYKERLVRSSAITQVDLELDVPAQGVK